MRTLVLGAAGFIGSRLAKALTARDGAAAAPGGDAELVFSDVRCPVAPCASGGPVGVRQVAGDLLDPGFLPSLFERPFDRVFHLAAALTLDAEADFAHGIALNVQALMRLLECCRAQVRPPRFVFASSISCFGGPLPAVVDDWVFQAPQTSYGVHKVIAEQLINDYSRRGFIDGRVLRLPIVLTHPGPASASVSDRIAALIRDPLRGRDVVCPLAPETPLAVASVDRVVDGLLRLVELPSTVFGATRAMNLPALTTTPAQIAAAVLRRRPGLAADRVRWRHDPALQRVVDGWPSRFTSRRAIDHGIVGDASIDGIVSACEAAEDR